MNNDSSSISSGNDNHVATTTTVVSSPVQGSPLTLTTSHPIITMNITTHPLVPKKYIDLSYQGLNDTNIDELLLDVLQANVTCLTQLNLYGNRLTFNSSSTQLVMAIGACTSLKVLSLGDNNIGPEGAANIASHIIAVTTSLVELHLGDNQLGDGGTTSIALMYQ